MVDVSQLSYQLVKSRQRVDQLEASADEMKALVSQTKRDGESIYKQLSDEVESYVALLDALQLELDDLVKHTSKVTLKFKEIVKNSDLEALEHHINAWPLETFARHDWFSSLLSSSLLQLEDLQLPPQPALRPVPKSLSSAGEVPAKE